MSEGFLYKKLTEKEKEEIQKEAERIINSFGNKLSKIKELPEEGNIKREKSFRVERNSSAAFPTSAPTSLRDGKDDEELKKRILANAPNKNNDFIIAEKKSWK
jgi:Asp-tRNA(Asn)/Glu-tRNA(Gln) amidotransferase C subunit